VDVSQGSKVITLPPTSQRPGRVITIKDSGSCSLTNTIAIQSDPSDSFESGSTTYLLNVSMSYVTIIADADNYIWRFITESIVNIPVLQELFCADLSTITFNTSSISSYTINTINISSVTASISTLYANNALVSSIYTNRISSALINSEGISSINMNTSNLSASNV
jgi:hypothetical protein